jgi:hypothetical protein
MPNWTSDQRESVDELLDIGSLSKWEYSFLTSVGSQMDRGWDLTEDQLTKLEEIIEEKGR